MKFTLEKAKKFGWDGLKGWAYSSKEEFERASSAYIEITGSHGISKSKLSDRIYYIISGKGEFTIRGNKIVVVKGDVIIVPRGNLYDFRSKKEVLKLFLVQTPAYVGHSVKKKSGKVKDE